MAGNSAAVKFVDLRKGFTNLARVPTQENEHEHMNLEEQGRDSKDTDLLVKVEMNPKQDKFNTPENRDSARRCIKWLSVSVVILFLMCLASIIASMVMVHELKHETLQKTLEMREMADLQMNISKGNENKLEEVIQNQAKREENLVSRIQGNENTLISAIQNRSMQDQKLDAISTKVQGIEVLLHAAFANQSNQERKLAAISSEIQGNENKLEEVIQNQAKREYNLLSRIQGIKNNFTRAFQVQSMQEQKLGAISTEMQGIEVLLQAAFANQSNQERKLAAISSEMQEISEIPFRKGCDDVNPPFTNIEEGNGTVVRILPSIAGGVWAYCQNIDGQLWTVLQRRQDGSIDFFRNWNDYVRGFGDPLGEFWLGLEAIHQLTNTGKYQLRLDMEEMNGTRWFAAYSSFSVGSGSEFYPLRVSGYSGNATDSLRVHNNDKFSTPDKDNDVYTSYHCAQDWKSGWWFSKCFDSNLNGVYGMRNASGVVWFQHIENRPNRRMNMRFTEMKMRQKQ